MLLKLQTVLALSAGTLLVLVCLPGNPPYFKVAASVAAKTYSNSMMAVLNSRIKAISNARTFRPPMWNEWVELIESKGEAPGIVFRRNCETDFEN